MKSQKILANPLTMYKTRNRVDKKPKIIKTPYFHLIEKLELPLEEPVWCPTAVKSGQSISIKAMVEYLNIAPAIERKAVLLIRAYDESGNEVNVQLDKMFKSEAFGAYFVYLPSTQSKVTELYTFVVPEGVSTIHFGFSRFLCSDDERVLVSDLTIYPQAVAQSSKKIKTASNHVIEKLELPLEDPVWCPTTVKTGQSISIKARVDYLNIAPAIERKAVLLIRAYDESGNEVNVQLDKMFKSEAFGAYFIYLPSTQSEVTELYTFVVPEGVSMIHFGFSRFLCSDDEQVVVSDLNIYPQAVAQSSKKIGTASNHLIEKLELPLEDPVWYPTVVKPGDSISIKALVEYLNIDPAAKRKAVLLIRAYDEFGKLKFVNLDKLFQSDAFGAYFKYLAPADNEVEDVYSFEVPEEVAIIYFGFSRFLCRQGEQVIINKLAIYPESVSPSSHLKRENSALGQIHNLSYHFKRNHININKSFPRISYDYGKRLWPNKVKDIRFISVLDEISESSWSEEFGLFRLTRNNFVKQVAASTANGLFLESCWNGNSGEWLYAFTSPELKHKNAQDLLKAISVAKSKGLPIMFWNKEDPMHYEKFLPIAEKCDIVFTTDVNKVDDYKKDLNNNNVYTLPFAANPYICNPMNRSRYEEENICFAGSYYSVGHDDRKQQMDDVLPALLNLDGIIYDRMSKLNNERYYFPDKYQNIIRDSVNFKEMTALYKHFKLFLNVNTITDSPSMMSRRVYELLACGTPVISTPSRALEEQFPNIVQIAESAEEVERIAKRLLNHPKEYEQLSHLGYREVMLKHTYENRKNVICKSLNIPNRNQQPLVSVILCTCRSYLIDRIVENLTRQNYQNIEVIFVLQDFSNTEISMLLDKVKASNIKRVEMIELNSKDISLGERFNTAAKIAKGEYIAKIDDDDFYFENYLTDMLIPFAFGDFALVGKREVFMYLEGQNKLIRRYPKQRHQTVEFVAGPTFVIKKSVFDQVKFEQRNTGEDSSFIKNIIIKGYKVYSSDPFNFVQFRASNSNHHTWKVKDQELLSGSQTEVICDGLDDSYYRF